MIPVQGGFWYDLRFAWIDMVNDPLDRLIDNLDSELHSRGALDPIPDATMSCSYCNADFKKNRPWQKYCSKSCGSKERAMRYWTRQFDMKHHPSYNQSNGGLKWANLLPFQRNSINFMYPLRSSRKIRKLLSIASNCPGKSAQTFGTSSLGPFSVVSKRLLNVKALVLLKKSFDCSEKYKPLTPGRNPSTVFSGDTGNNKHHRAKQLIDEKKRERLTGLLTIYFKEGGVTKVTSERKRYNLGLKERPWQQDDVQPQNEPRNRIVLFLWKFIE